MVNHDPAMIACIQRAYELAMQCGQTTISAGMIAGRTLEVYETRALVHYWGAGGKGKLDIELRGPVDPTQLPPQQVEEVDTFRVLPKPTVTIHFARSSGDETHQLDFGFGGGGEADIVGRTLGPRGPHGERLSLEEASEHLAELLPSVDAVKDDALRDRSFGEGNNLLAAASRLRYPYAAPLRTDR